MNIIAFCCALNNTYLAIQFGDKIYEKVLKSDENYHSLYLISTIKTFFTENNLKFTDLDLICVNTGPGSFTGIRVALTTAKVMAGELNKPIVPLTTNEILLKHYGFDKLIMDARRDMFFVSDVNEVKLVLKDKIEDYILNTDKILTDKNTSEILKNSVCFEEKDENIALCMLKLAKEKFSNANSKDEFNYLNVNANYIQTPPVF